MRRLGMLLGTVAVLALALPPITHAANRVKVVDNSLRGETTFYVPNGGNFLNEESRCPADTGFEGEWVATVCPFTLTVEQWASDQKERVPVLRYESEPGHMSDEVILHWPDSCKPGGPYFWTAEVFTEDGSYRWVERGRDEPEEAGFCHTKPEPIHYRPSRLEAQRAVVDFLSPLYVSRLRCRPHDRLHQLCEATFNNTYAECRGAYWVEGFNHSDPSKDDGPQTWPSWKRCRPL